VTFLKEKYLISSHASIRNKSAQNLRVLLDLRD